MNLCKELNRLIALRKGLREDVDYHTNPVMIEMIGLMTENLSETLSFDVRQVVMIKKE